MAQLCLPRLTEQATRIYSFILGNGVENGVCANLTSSKGSIWGEKSPRDSIKLSPWAWALPWGGGGSLGGGSGLGCARSRAFLRHRLHLWKRSRRTVNANKVTLMKWGNSADRLCADFKWYLIAGSVRTGELFITALEFFLSAFLGSHLEGLPGTRPETHCCQGVTFSRTKTREKKEKAKKRAWVTEQFSFFLLFLPETPRLSPSYANVPKKDTIVPGTILKRREPYLKCPKPSISLSVQKSQLSWCWDAVTLSASHLVQVSSPSLTRSQFLSFIFSTTAFISFL